MYYNVHISSFRNGQKDFAVIAEAQSICRMYIKSQKGKGKESRGAFLVLGKQPLALDPVCTSITFPVFFDRKHQRVSPS